MKKIIAFGASNSLKSINQKLAAYAAAQVADAKVQLLDLNEYEMPIYSIDSPWIVRMACQFRIEVG